MLTQQNVRFLYETYCLMQPYIANTKVIGFITLHNLWNHESYYME